MATHSINGDDGAGRQKSIPVNYPANSHKAREIKPEKNVEKVITGDAIQRKKPMGTKLKEVIAGDDAQSVASYIFFDVIVPAAKSMLADATSQFIERLLFGDSRPRSGGKSGAYTSYNRMYNGRASEQPRKPEISQRGRANHNFGEVILSTRGEAEEVLDRLMALIDEYSVATVSDLYDLVGITGNFTDDKWGWYDLRGSGITRIREGYLINLPQTQPVD